MMYVYKQYPHSAREVDGTWLSDGHVPIRAFDGRPAAVGGGGRRGILGTGGSSTASTVWTAALNEFWRAFPVTRCAAVFLLLRMNSVVVGEKSSISSRI